MKKTVPLAVAVLTSLGLVAGSTALPSCGGSAAVSHTGGGSGGSGTASSTGAGAGGEAPDGGGGGRDAGEDGGDAGTIYIPPSMCKPVGAANELVATDPNAQGQCIFLLDAWGTEVLGEWPPTAFMLGLLKSDPAFFGDQFESFGFIPDPNDDLPIGFKRGLIDPTKIHETCALCHTAKLPDGRLWFGAPSNTLDFGRFQVEVDKRWVAAGNAAKLTPLAAQKSVTLGPGRTDAESGDYPIAVPADFPAYFTLGQRTSMNYLGTGGNVRTEAYFSIYTFGAGSPNDQTAQVAFPSDAKTAVFLAFFGALASPDGPAQDAALVAQGKTVFTSASCGSCHHPEDIALDGVVTYDKTPGDVEQLPGVVPAFPRGSIRTDILHRALIDDSVGPDAGASDAGADTGYMDLNNFIVDHKLNEKYSDGYRDNDLRGLWATAPYLHNGSVPTLDDLLNPAAQRPATWMRGGFLVDTTVLGNGNGGHEFGTTLSTSDKAALVAYLKSL